MIYALWYIFRDDEKTTNAISLDKNILDNLQKQTELNFNNLYHLYKKSITKIYIESIDCYKYNEEFKKIERIQNYNELSNGLFYASQYLLDSGELTDILIYLTNEQHEIWRKCCQEKYKLNYQEIKYPYFFLR
jgi:hypothetical protein